MPSTRSSTRSGSAATHNRSRRDTTIPDSRLGDHLPARFSELTRYAHIPVFDVAAWVNRDTATRHAEVRIQDKRGRVGHIARPHNPFMLYRRAYHHRIRALCEEHITKNQQSISAVAGASWKREPPAVRQRFVEWAEREKEGHREAWPEYKYQLFPLKKKVELPGPANSESERDLPVASHGGAVQVASSDGVDVAGADLQIPTPTAGEPESFVAEQQFVESWLNNTGVNLQWDWTLAQLQPQFNQQLWQQLPQNMTLGALLSLQAGLQQQPMLMQQPVLCARCACVVTQDDGATNQAVAIPDPPQVTQNSLPEASSDSRANLTISNSPSAVPDLDAITQMDALNDGLTAEDLESTCPIDGLVPNPLEDSFGFSQFTLEDAN